MALETRNFSHLNEMIGPQRMSDIKKLMVSIVPIPSPHGFREAGCWCLVIC